MTANRMTVTLSRVSWTVGAFGGTFALKLVSTLVLSRLLAPQVFGIVVIVNTVRVGVELLSDIGIEQNIVRHPDGLTPQFFNTAWTLQMLRGLVLASIFAALSPLLASFYAVPVDVFLLMSLAPLLNSMHSTSIFALVKQLEVHLP